MAFFNKIGNVISQSISQNSASSLMTAIRCMSNKIFVGGLSFGTDDGSLREAFSNFGDVTDARVITDRMTGRSRGFGFVTFTDSESANNALGMDGQDLQGRTIRVNIANERPPGPRPGGYNSGGYGGGGYGGGGGGYGGGGYRGGEGGGYRGGEGGGYQRNAANDEY